ncbi:MAG: alpha/beta hydrolase [Bacteroidota bacterium]
METIAKTIYLKPAAVARPAEQAYKPSRSLRLVQLFFSSVGRMFPRVGARLAYRLFATPRIRARHRESDRILASARIHDFLYGGQLLKSYTWGDGDKTILLVHGWESRGTALRSFVPDLLAKGYKVVTFDAPAHGNSAGKRTNLPNFAGAVVAAIHHFGKVDSIITHSFGGSSTVFALASKENDLSIDKLVLIGVPSNLFKEILSYLKVIHAPQNLQREFLKIIQRLISEPLESVDVSLAFDRVKVGKTLIVHDKSDQVVPFHNAERVASRWANASLLVSEGYGHFQLMKNPELVEQVTRFIDE